MKSIVVTRSSQVLVIPAEPTPTVTLPLSSIEKYPVLRYPIPLFHVYPTGGEAAAPVIRDALAKALVHYYPLAGELLDDSDGGGVAQVDCSGEGAWFAEASADCTLEDVGHLEHPFPIDVDDLLPLGRVDRKPLYLQVTQFACGGFVVGIQLSHAMVDGIGCGQFFKGVAELARGIDQPSIKPVWLREAIPPIPKSPPILLLSLPSLSFHHHDVHFSLDYINRVKQDYSKSTGNTCSTFDVAVALLWQCRTRAVKYGPGVELHLYFSADIRRFFSDVLPPEGGYYGNCIYLVHAKCSSELLIDMPVLEVVQWIRDAKAKLPEDIKKWRRGEMDEDPYVMEMGYETLTVTDWGRIGLREIDYGWGTPTHIINVIGAPYAALCYLGLPAAKENSHRAMLRIVTEEHLSAFQHEVRSVTLD